MKKNKTDAKKFKIKGLNWVYYIGMMVTIGGVMAYGLIGAAVFDFDDRSSLTMLAMIPLMGLVCYFSLSPVVKSISRRMERLAQGMNEVSEGNLSYQIELKDAGEYKVLYEQFNAMTAELKKTRQEMEDFTNEFAHEFKTPITAINGFAEVLLQSADGLEKEERDEYLKMIEDESRRLLNLSQNTLLLSKVEAMQIVADKKSIDLAEQLRRCIILLEKPIEDKEIEIVMDEDLKLFYNGNEEILEHVWINLLNNAVKFTPQGGRIEIKGRKENDNVIVSITDSGIGMDEETCRHIFDKYYQNDTVSLNKGSGIGLAIVRRIVTLCGGEITVSSWPGSGSTFTVSL